MPGVNDSNLFRRHKWAWFERFRNSVDFMQPPMQASTTLEIRQKHSGGLSRSDERGSKDGNPNDWCLIFMLS